jgi:hypothetical protein
MPAVDLPPQLPERVVCSIAAAVRYELPANVMLAVAEQEGGRPGQWVLNTNGTHDVGALQFNTSYLAQLAPFGITASDVAASGCYAYDLAAWRLRKHIRDDSGDLWTRVANYHSRTPVYNARYRAGVMSRAAKWADWIAARFATVELRSSPALPVVQASGAEDPLVSSAGYVQRKLVHPGEAPR